MADIFPFLFFGCWNQPGPLPEPGQAEVKVPRDVVFEHIRSHQGDAKLIVFGGDNIYPRPLPSEFVKEGKKNKKHEIPVFDEGLGMYKTLGRSMFTAFGNHNVVEPEMKAHQMSAFGVSKTYYVKTFGNVHFIVLDSNIIGANEDEYEPMRTWFETTVRELPAEHAYFLIQHDPYFTARSKGFSELKYSEPFLDIVFRRPPIAILCADTHHYQHAILSRSADPSIQIHQFIVGTGGANHDLYKTDFAKYTFRETYDFIKVEEVAGFGYVRIEGPDAAACRFIKVLDWPSAKKGGSRRRRSSRRNHTKRRRSSN